MISSVLFRGGPSAALQPRAPPWRGYQIAPLLCNDWESSNEELARRLVGRCLQENGIKTLTTEHGIDEITSYLTVPYGEPLAKAEPAHFATVSQRVIDNPRRKKLDAECCKLRKRFKTLAERRSRVRKQGRSRGHVRVRKVEEEWQATQAALAEAEVKRAHEPKEINQLRYLVEEGYERPCFSRKLFLGLLKICACNARAQAAEVLKQYYANRRDHLTLLRRMLHASGQVRLDAKGGLQVRLERLNTDAENRVFADFLADLNGRNPRTLGPRNHPMHLALRNQS